MTAVDVAATVVELVACPASPRPAGPLREMAFRRDAWTGGEVERLRRLFEEDASLDDIAAALGRGRAGVADKIGLLGLRRNSTRPWSDLEDEELARRYGTEPTAAIASDFGRSCAAIYARAGLLGLTEAISPFWTEWEDAQLRAGYAAGVPVAQIATLVGRPLGGISSRAAALAIVHANQPAGWTEAEAARALELAEAGHRYREILNLMAAEGFPKRSIAGFGPVVRRLGYGRGWGRPWLPEEDALLRQAYEAGASLTPLRTRLGRTGNSIRWRAHYLELQGTHVRANGFRGGPDWTEADIALLRAEYGKTPNPALAAKLGRTKAAMFTRANLLGLVHGYIRPFSAEETRALDQAYQRGVAIADLAMALGRKPCSVSKYAINHGYRFGRRRLREGGITLAELLAGEAPARDSSGVESEVGGKRAGRETCSRSVIASPQIGTADDTQCATRRAPAAADVRDRLRRRRVAGRPIRLAGSTRRRRFRRG